MFISRKRRTEVAINSKSHFAVDMKSFFAPVELDSPICRMDISVFWGLPFITKIGARDHIQ